MTDQEIVQALRSCANGESEDCPFAGHGVCGCPGMSADLIERLSAENADLRKELEWKDMVISLAQRKQAEAEAERDKLRERRLWETFSDGAPKEKGCYLVTERHWFDGMQVVREAFWNGEDWLSCERRHEITPRVTHWTPLPEAPEKGDML